MEADVKIETEIQEEEFDIKNQVEDINQDDDYNYEYEQDDDVEEKKRGRKGEEKPLKSSKKSLKWVCADCNDSFTTKQSLKNHCQIYHKKCAKCDKTFVDKDKHYEVWHSKVECKHCEYICENKNQMKVHMKEKHKSFFSRQLGLGSTRCRICNDEFESKEINTESG